MILDRYMGSYLDRRMKYLIEEWDLATRNDVSDYSRRLDVLAEEISRISAVEEAATVRLAALETRAKMLEAAR